MTKLKPPALPSRFALVACVLALASTLGGAAMANGAAFESRQVAEDYLTRTLPIATAANPKYLTKSEGVESSWLTKSVRFEDTTTGIRVAMDEAFTQTKDGVSTPGPHGSAFSLAAVDISALTLAGDVTPSGDASMGILFACSKPGCVAANWNGQAGAADKTDISLQDTATRERVLAAFLFLKGAGKPPD
jgi:hypothetical protein